MQKLIIFLLICVVQTSFAGDTLKLSDFKRETARSIAKHLKYPSALYLNTPHSFSMVKVLAKYDVTGSVAFLDTATPNILLDELRRVLSLSYNQKFKQYAHRPFLITLMIMVDTVETIPSQEVVDFMKSTLTVLSEQEVIVIPPIEVNVRSSDLK
jgi:hypothetical protein